ncbi:MAG: hypothetical protein ACLSCQ_06790 [Evtepia gabavorous]
MEGCGPGLPGGGKGAVTAGQRFQGTLSLGQIDLGLGQVPGCLLVVGPGLSKGLPGFIQPFCFVPGDGVEKAHGPLGFQGGHLLFRGLPGLPAGFRLDERTWHRSVRAARWVSSCFFRAAWARSCRKARRSSFW